MQSKMERKSKGKVNNKWYARLKCDGIEHSRGGFDTREEAVIARRELEDIYFGEYAARGNSDDKR